MIGGQLTNPKAVVVGTRMMGPGIATVLALGGMETHLKKMTSAQKLGEGFMTGLFGT